MNLVNNINVKVCIRDPVRMSKISSLSIYQKRIVPGEGFHNNVIIYVTYRTKKCLMVQHYVQRRSMNLLNVPVNNINVNI